MSSFSSIGNAVEKVKNPLIFFAFTIGILATIIPIIDPFRTGPGDEPYGFYISMSLLFLIGISIVLVTIVVFRRPEDLTSSEEGRIEKYKIEQEFKLENVRLTLERGIKNVEATVEAKAESMEDWYGALKIIAAGEDPIAKQRLGHKLVIGSKEFPDSKIINEIISRVIQHYFPDFEIERKFGFGGSLTNLMAIQYGYVDLYVDYTGTGMQYAFGEKGTDNPQKDVERLNRHYDEKKITWLRPFHSYNNFEIIMLKETTEKNKIKTISDLNGYSKDFVIGGTNEFLKRDDGLGVLTKDYGLVFKETRTIGDIDRSERYTLLKEKIIDVSESQSADVDFNKKDFIKLKDDKGFCSKYFHVPVIRDDVLMQFDDENDETNKLVKVLDRIVDSQITSDDIANLIYQSNSQLTNVVVESFLKEKKII